MEILPFGSVFILNRICCSHVPEAVGEEKRPGHLDEIAMLGGCSITLVSGRLSSRKPLDERRVLYPN